MSRFRWTDADVRAALGMGRDSLLPDLEFTGVSTDSRSVEAGELYVALIGERFDGHDFVTAAVALGALGAVVSRRVEADSEAVLYYVDDTLEALGALAAHRRRALTVPVVGITGSVGKTTTKDLTRAALHGSLRVHATRGNLNNRIGMPLTLLAAPTDTEAVVLEMGTNEPGEIAALTRVARPDIGVITTVGESHLEKLGSVQGVLEEKLDLLRGLATDGHCVVGDEPPELAEAARRECPLVRVAGWSDRADEGLRPRGVAVDPSGAHRFTWQEETVLVSLPGRHAATDALFALAVAEILGIPPREAVEGIASVAGAAMRGEVRSIGGLTVLVDCYNSSPMSVRAALEVLEGRSGSARVAVLGTMLELGAETPRLHVEVLAGVLARDVELIVATGAFAEAAAGISDPRLLTAPTWQDAYSDLAQRLAGDEVVLLKASRGVAMEAMLPRLEADFGRANGSGEVA